MGDPAGIGPEIAVKSSQYFINAGGIARPVILGSLEHIERTARNVLKSNLPINPVNMDLPLEETFVEKAVNVADLSSVSYGKVRMGELNPRYAGEVEKFIESAVMFSRAGAIDGFATAPINKDMMLKGGARFGGHTELLGYLSGSDDFAMLFYSKKLTVILVTIHIPIASVPKAITMESLDKIIKIGTSSLKKDFGKQDPRVAVLGLNPHAGENGKIGHEDKEVISPVIRRFADSGLKIEGPFPADSFFASRYSEFDLIVAMYHDQALIPFKLFSFERGVNVTVGLDIIRTSPVHGTAYDIAGKNIADCASMIESVRLARIISKNRKEWIEK